MQKLILQAFLIIYVFSLITPKEMVCTLINRSVSRCYWTTRDKCCYIEDNCGMLKTARQCQRNFFWTEIKLKNKINQALAKEWAEEN